MMRVSKFLGSVVAGLAAVVALSATTESRAGGDEELVDYKCVAGALEAKGVGEWHTNAEAPWKWEKLKPTFSEQGKQKVASFKGESCSGKMKAFVCAGDKCKGPIVIGITEKPKFNK